MHPNPTFRQTPDETACAFARDRGFGVLTAAGAEGIMAAHVPFLLSGDGRAVEAHLVRSNPLARALRDAGQPVCLIVSGPDGYISPDWYGTPDQVPTWNYVAVHLHGTLRLAPEESLRAHLDAVSARFEGTIPDKRPWTADKMTDGVMERMMRGIVPVAMTVERVESTVKLNQNKPDAARIAAAAHVDAGTTGQETGALAALMRDPPA